MQGAECSAGQGVVVAGWGLQKWYTAVRERMSVSLVLCWIGCVQQVYGDRLWEEKWDGGVGPQHKAGVGRSMGRADMKLRERAVGERQPERDT